MIPKSFTQITYLKSLDIFEKSLSQKLTDNIVEIFSLQIFLITYIHIHTKIPNSNTIVNNNILTFHISLPNLQLKSQINT